MRREIHQATVHYKWRTIRIVKGVEKPSKKWNNANHTTCITATTPEELEKRKYFINSLQIKHKSTNDIQIKIERVENLKFICMSRDIY